MEDGNAALWDSANRVFLILSWGFQGEKKILECFPKRIVVNTKENSWKQLTRSKQLKKKKAKMQSQMFQKPKGLNERKDLQWARWAKGAKWILWFRFWASLWLFQGPCGPRVGCVEKGQFQVNSMTVFHMWALLFLCGTQTSQSTMHSDSFHPMESLHNNTGQRQKRYTVFIMSISFFSRGTGL